MIKRKTNGSSCVIVKLIHKPHRKDNAFAMNFKTAQDSSKLFIIFHAYLAMYAKIQFMPTNPFFKKFQIFLSTRQSEEILGTDNSRQKFPAFWGRSRSPLILESFLPDGTLSSRLPASRSFPFD